MWFFRWLLILIAAAAAVIDFGLEICSYLNKNCLFRLDVSMWSGSVKVSYPLLSLLLDSPVHKDSIAKFLRSSQPIAPLPIINRFKCFNLSSKSFPMTV